MYEFHYDIMKSIYNDKIRLCYQDTDSLIYEIETDDTRVEQNDPGMILVSPRPSSKKFFNLFSATSRVLTRIIQNLAKIHSFGAKL